MAAPKPIILYTRSTPNSHKVTLALEELKRIGAKVDYDVQILDFDIDEQKQPWFLKINPNGRIPAIIDRSRNDFKVFESAAILLYLQENYDTKSEFHFKSDPDLQSELLQWMFFIHGGIGPMQGQAHHFTQYAPKLITYGVKRYVEETKRLYSVIEERLKGRDYIVGQGKGKYTWADMTAHPWIRYHVNCGVELDEFPNIKAWLNRIDERPATSLGLLTGHMNIKSKAMILNETPGAVQKTVDNVKQWIKEEENSRKQK